MHKLQTSLLREKFVIHDGSAGTENGTVTALSNRIVLELPDESGKIIEDTIIVRAHNMHSCARLAGKLIQSHISNGSLVTRPRPYDWAAAWDSVVSDYEKDWNPQLWAVIYSQGKVLFSTGDHHPLLDVIESCAASNRGEYEKSIPMAEETFRTMGKVVRINYDGNVALTLTMEARQARIGVIVRNPAKTATFNFSVSSKPPQNINYTQCLGAAAAFLEGIQLAFMVGMNEEKIKLGQIKKSSKEDLQTRDARKRLGRLSSEISTLEGTYDVRYRPERPEFQDVLLDAEKLAKTLPRRG